ncbi:site-2 protease family protein [Leptolyngbya sp. O-77]|uniref:site-2 protease family protein n=1 Tax=Leptolyngbya sp. O-77 TaxID=1080068 RepID=UPI00074D3C81|nr:site-2 protease family protein [Leptolyngbya sp. O-77]BAU40492.1 Putative zinc metalloprotease Rip3 [Leptolyngbya sp. O-77]
MENNLRVGNLFGIPFYINPSWFLVLALVTWNDGSWLSYQFPQLGALAWVLGLVTALLLFASVLAHELGHSWVALRQGTEVKSITLFIFGGLASLGEESKTPGESFRVAIAGPLVSLFLFGVLHAIGSFSGITGPLAAMVALLSYVNLALAVFNMIPGLPLDGGNVLKAIVWKITGKPYRGLAFASRVGQVFGWLGIGLGLASTLGLTNIGSVWTLLVGFFLLQNAGRSAQAASVQELMSGLTAADAVIPNSPVVPAQSSLREFANNYIIGNPVNWKKYLVTDEAGKLAGEIWVDDMKQVPTNDWWNVSVQSLVKVAEEIQTVPATTPLLEVIDLLSEQVPALAVVKPEDGSVLGLLEKSSILMALQKKSEAQPA